LSRDARWRADLALVLVSLFWGVTFPLIRGALESVEPFAFIGWRFALATAAFLPFVLVRPEARRGLARVLGPGALLGALAWTAYVSQTIGLQTVPAGRAAFITGTSVIIVPLLAPAFRAGAPRRIDLLAALVAAAGLYLLTRGEGHGEGLGTGDLWVVGCAVSYSVYLLVLQRVLRVQHDVVALSFVQVASIGVVGGSILAARGGVGIELNGEVLRALLFCALVATVGTFWLQTRFQGSTTPQRAALIFALEPVFATVFAWWWLGEGLDPAGMAGAALILAAVLGVELMALGSADSRAAASGSGKAGPTPVDSRGHEFSRPRTIRRPRRPGR